MFALAAAAGLAVLAGTMTGTTAAHAAASVPAPAAAAHAHPMFEPCPCDKPICRPGCSQNMAFGGPASLIHPGIMILGDRWANHPGDRPR